MIKKNSLLFFIFYSLYVLHGQQVQGFEKVNLGFLCDYSITNELAQDSFGSIWIATDEGLLRYNSKESFLYNEYKGFPKSFNNKIHNVFVDSNNNIWASSDNHLAKFSAQNNQFIEVTLPADTKGFSFINDIEQYDENLLIATFSGLWNINLKEKQYNPTQNCLKDVNILSLEIENKLIFLGTTKGSYTLSSLKNSPKLISENESFISVLKVNEGYLVGTKSGELRLCDEALNTIKSLYQFKVPIVDIVRDANNSIFVGTDGKGILQLDEKFTEVKKYNHKVNDDLTLPNDGIYDLMIGKKNQLWVASYGGGVLKSKIGEQTFNYIEQKNNGKEGLINNFTRAICKTDEGDIWFGTKEGISIKKLNGTWLHLPSIMRIKNESDIILSFFEKGDFMWVGTYGNGAFKINKKTLATERFSVNASGKYKIPIDKIYAILEDEKGVWLGGIGGPLVNIANDGTQKKYNVREVRALVKSPSGEVYVIGRLGVQKILGDTSQIISAVSDKNKFNYTTSNCLLFINDDEFWLGTNGDGLIIYSISKKTVKTISMADGLPSDIIQGIVKIKDDYWVSTSRGIVHLFYEGKQLKFRLYNEKDGLKSAVFNYGSFDTWDDHTIAFGSLAGVVSINVDKIPKSEEVQKLFFENIEVLAAKGKNAISTINLYGHKAEEIKLKYWQNFIKIKFASIDFLNASKLNYSWSMKGVNEQWSLPQEENELNFSNLPTGSYTLKIRSVNALGVPGNEEVLHFKISPPWYASIWAFLIYTLIAFYLAYTGYKLTRTLVKKKNADEQISFYNNITHELKTPLSILLSKLDNYDPNTSSTDIKSTIHRLNSLFDQLLNFNKVSSQYYQNQKVSAINIEHHFRMIINNFQNEMNKKNISLNFENDYPHQLFYYKKDVLEKISYNLISNAVKYTGSGGTITIKLSENEEGSLIAIFTDNGIGIPKDQHKDILKRYYRARNAINSQLPGTGLGLMMVKNLLDVDKGKISFISEQGLGTSFTLTLKNFNSNFVPLEDTVNPIIPILEEDAKNQDVLNKYKVLIVEDNDELRIDMVEKLSEQFSIIAARNGKEGYEKAKSRMPDLIITDLIMPEMDGNELCRSLQADENTNHIPVFMMTVLNDSTQKVESIKSGINTYMTKPIDFPYLIAKINSVLEYKQKLKEKYLHETEVEKSTKFKDERSAEFVSSLEAFIIEHIADEEISVQDLCKHAGMSRTSLYMKLTEMIEQSPQNFIFTTKMNYARNLLLKGGKTVQEIAFMVGFNNPKYFSTSFKKQFGVSPSGFLKSLNPE